MGWWSGGSGTSWREVTKGLSYVSVVAGAGVVVNWGGLVKQLIASAVTAVGLGGTGLIAGYWDFVLGQIEGGFNFVTTIVSELLGWAPEAAEVSTASIQQYGIAAVLVALFVVLVTLYVLYRFIKRWRGK